MRRRKKRNLLVLEIAVSIAAAIGIGYSLGSNSREKELKALVKRNEHLVSRLEKAKYHLGELFERIKGG